MSEPGRPTPAQPGDGGEDRGHELSPTTRRAWLAAILLLGVGLRSYRLSWGLPRFIFFDSSVFFVEPASRLLTSGDWSTNRFVHPPALTYALAGVASAWAQVSGGSPEIFGLASLDWIGRVLTVALSTLSIAVLYLLARRLVGTRAGLLAAGAFALCPVHVLEAHRIHTDSPMLLLGLASAHQAVLARDERSRRRLWLSFALAGLAGSVKYTGLACVTVPAWIALTWPGAPMLRRILTLIGGGILALVVFLTAIAPLLLEWEALLAKLQLIRFVGMSVGQPGEDLRGEGWVYTRYVYALVAALPYLIGWAVYLAALAGLCLLPRCQRARGPIFAAVVPYFLFQGAAETIVARYYLPLAPYLCMAAGHALDRATARKRWTGIATSLAVLGYTLLLTGSQCLRIPGPVQPVADDLREQIEVAKSHGRQLVLGYPGRLLVAYDPVSPAFRDPREVRLVPFPPSGARRFPLSAHSLDRYRAWLESEKIDAVLLTSRPEGIARREGKTSELDFFKALEDGRLGFRLKRASSTRFFTQELYTWADPSLETNLTAGILGHKLFVREPTRGSASSEP